jgi:hypothetical protein
MRKLGSDFRAAVLAAPEGMLLRVTVSHPDYVTLEVPEWDTSIPHDICLQPRPPSQPQQDLDGS